MKNNSGPLLFEPEWTRALASLLPSVESPLFPFPVVGGTHGDLMAAMQKAGIVDQKHSLSETVEAGLLVLARSQASVRVRIMDDELQEFHVYLSKNDSLRSASLRPAGKKVCLEYPAPIAPMLHAVENLIGASALCEVPAVGRLSADESLALAGVIDQTRRELLAAMGQDLPWRSSPVTATSLVEVLGRKDLDSTRLLWLVKGILPSGTEPSSSSLQQAMDRLAEKQLLERRDSGFIATQESLYLAGRFLRLLPMIRIDAWRVSGKGATRGTCAICQGGVRDLLLLEVDGTDIQWAGISGKGVIELLNEFFTNPELIKPADLSHQPADDRGRCHSCGKDIEPGDPFCKFCGASQQAETQAKPRFCSKCGSELKPGKKFCPKCGAPGK